MPFLSLHEAFPLKSPNFFTMASDEALQPRTRRLGVVLC